MVGCSGLDLRPPQAWVAPAVRRACRMGSHANWEGRLFFRRYEPDQVRRVRSRPV